MAADTISNGHTDPIPVNSIPNVLSEKPGAPAPAESAHNLKVESHSFENIVNFRDVGASTSVKTDQGVRQYIKHGILFRSGRLDDASTSDLETLTATYNIRTIVDLRSETEGKIGSMLANTFPAGAIAAVKPTDMMSQVLPPHVEDRLSKLNAKHVSVASETVVTGQRKSPTDTRLARKRSTVVAMDDLKKELSKSKQGGLTTRTTYFVNFAGSKYRYYCVIKPCPFALKLKLIGWMMIGRKDRAIRAVGSQVLQPKGLQGLNYDFLDYCGEQIIQVIRIMIASATYPILIHCTQGKDRTGLVIAIVLSLCDVPRPLIIQDYVKTQKGLEAQREVMVQEMAKTGLDATFSDAPEQVIVDTLKYLDNKYGGAEGYVKKYELQDDEIRALRAIFVAEGLSRQSNVVNANTVVALKQKGYDDLVA
ncbi:hypothetical protein K450DRAFT_257505 [Umbelopsis ramanniana AG]|uniref:Tyrosine specific protein phosphatases domain-containing protein n=1 Tax=Umbelopsis ramanniana AG TaxID=1314678 RepID=A0AAD5E4N8_UMBRA|nr:uncharacterized protein K450DRAFT_257505 [Umbelopsis ramanniana AG]KAI8576275.1 hypothetical protein K450DRAFT_257505 [Umbelopsis ramanniana AG]